MHDLEKQLRSTYMPRKDFCEITVSCKTGQEYFAAHDATLHRIKHKPNKVPGKIKQSANESVVKNILKGKND